MIIAMFTKQESGEAFEVDRYWKNIPKLRKQDQYLEWREQILILCEKANILEFVLDLFRYRSKMVRVGSRNIESSLQVEIRKTHLVDSDHRKEKDKDIIHNLNSKQIHAFKVITKIAKSISSRLKAKVDGFNHFAVPLDIILSQLDEYYRTEDRRDSTDSETENIRFKAMTIAHRMNLKNRTDAEIDQEIKDKRP